MEHVMPVGISMECSFLAPMVAFSVSVRLDVANVRGNKNQPHFVTVHADAIINGKMLTGECTACPHFPVNSKVPALFFPVTIQMAADNLLKQVTGLSQFEEKIRKQLVKVQAFCNSDQCLQIVKNDLERDENVEENSNA